MDLVERSRQVLAEQFGWTEFRRDKRKRFRLSCKVEMSWSYSQLAVGNHCVTNFRPCFCGHYCRSFATSRIDERPGRSTCSQGHSRVRLDSSMTAQENHKAQQLLQENKCKLLFVAPERFLNERFRRQLGQLSISLFAIDEAHCISQWGHNFRPDYLKLAGIAKACKAERILALTAPRPQPFLTTSGFSLTLQTRIALSHRFTETT